MVELLSTEIYAENRRSSKGNQLKWQRNNRWYKADYTGYEGLSEYMVSQLLAFSNLRKEEYVLYWTEKIRYKEQFFKGCGSENFIPDGWQLLTLERLFQQQFGESLYQSVFRISGITERLQYLVSQTERMTELGGFGEYLTKLLTVDAFFLNEDRHTHNIAVLMDPHGRYHLCPLFDQGASLLSDTTMDYPMSGELYNLIYSVKAKTVSTDFMEALEAAEVLYGQQLDFHFSRSTILKLLEKETCYPPEIKERVCQILLKQSRKYRYLFK